MNTLVCEDCGTFFYSAAATAMVARGERCEVCGGALELADDRPQQGSEVAVGADRASAGPRAGGRFERR